VSQPNYLVGATTLDSMPHLLGGRPAEPNRVPAELVIRASTGPAPASFPLKRLKKA